MNNDNAIYNLINLLQNSLYQKIKPCWKIQISPISIIAFKISLVGNKTIYKPVIFSLTPIYSILLEKFI